MAHSARETLLQIHASGRRDGSNTRALSDTLVSKLKAEGAVSSVIESDLLDGVAFVDQDWINANFTLAGERNQDQLQKLAGSDALVEELEGARTVVIGMPIYNFGPPAVLKAWIDQIARAGRTFQYGPSGPAGLLSGKRAFLIIASGGTEIGSVIDFATDYMKHTLDFIGISDVTVIGADRLMTDGDASLAAAQAKIASIQA